MLYVPAMALFHRATLEPTKEQLIADWIPHQPWGPAGDQPIEVIGGFRFDDPDGQVGLETFLCSAESNLFQVPLTYRDTPLAGAEAALISEMHHSVLGRRWVYDGLRDPVYVTMLAAATLTGQGEALGMAVYEGRWYIAPTNVRIHGGGWTLERVPVDRLELISDEAPGSVLRSDRFQLTVYRRPKPGREAPLTLTATWPGQDAPVVLAAVEDQSS